MNKVIAIICEYNPFHNGHKYQIDKIKETFPGSTIIAIMSGNVVQRGEMATFDKYTRAESAILSGVNAVFEIPVPFSCANAEIFAFAGVKIANDLGADYLCFGSESDDIEYLNRVACAIDSEAFEEKFSEQLKDKSQSYIVLKEKALSAIGVTLPREPNDMLAVEYLRAINKINSKIIPYPVKRIGSGYKDMSDGETMSASAIRRKLYDENTLVSIPAEAKVVFEREFSKGAYLDLPKVQEYLFHNTLMSTPEAIEALFDAPKGVGYFVSKLSKDSDGYESFFANLTSKSYTRARLTRIIMYLALKVKDINRNGIFTVLLATDKNGREFIKRTRKKCNMLILTKQADSKKLNPLQFEMYEISRTADEMYFSFLKSPLKARDIYKRTIIVI